MPGSRIQLLRIQLLIDLVKQQAFAGNPERKYGSI
jgi:hypothetical protein